MKIALVHDYIKEYGGAERVLEALHEIWPKAPVFTTVYLPEFLGPHKKRFADWDIRTSWLQRLSLVHRLISPIRVLTPWVFENWDFSDFDVVLVSATGAYFPNLIVRRPDTLHICYCHTPPRYLYGYKTARDWKKHFLGRAVGGLVNHHLRQIDFLSYQRPDYIIANSREVKRRIKKFYRREAEVIYPPVGLESRIKNSLDSPSTSLGVDARDKHESRIIKKKDYYLTGGRLARAKNIDLAIKTCNKLGTRLKVFGKGFAGYEKELRQIAGPKTEFLGEVTDEKLIEVYKEAKALIYPPEDEDFGIMPVEAQACGTPVIAFRGGGVLESVIEGKTGVFFNKLSTDQLVAAIKHFDNTYYRSDMSKACIRQAKKFSKGRFKREIRKFVEKQYEVNH